MTTIEDRGTDDAPMPGAVGTNFLRLAVLLTAYSVVYFPLALWLSRDKRMWFDEILTYHLARLPNPIAIWRALSDGPDASPPLNLMLIHFTTRLLGPTPLACRLPAILGLWLMGVAVSLFVARSLRWPFAALALLLPWPTVLLRFVCEARPYGLWLGLIALALVFWQAAINPASRHRGLMLWGLFLASSCVVASHLLAPVSLLPILFGEAVRTLRNRRVDPPVWAALIAAGASALLYLPMYRNAQTYMATFFSRPGLTGVLTFYTEMFAEAGFAAIAGMSAVALGLSLTTRAGRNSVGCDHSTLPAHEVAACLGFLGFPFLIFAIGQFAGGSFVPRYCLVTVIGFAILGAFIASRSGWGVPVTALLAAAIGVSGIVGVHSYDKRQRWELAAMRELAESVDRFGDGLPVGVTDHFTFADLNYYGSDALAGRLVFLRWESAAASTGGMNIEKLAPWALKSRPVRFDTLPDFLDKHETCLIVAEWTSPEQARLIKANKDRFEEKVTDKVYLVRRPPGRHR